MKRKICYICSDAVEALCYGNDEDTEFSWCRPCMDSIPCICGNLAGTINPKLGRANHPKMRKSAPCCGYFMNAKRAKLDCTTEKPNVDADTVRQKNAKIPRFAESFYAFCKHCFSRFQMCCPKGSRICEPCVAKLCTCSFTPKSGPPTGAADNRRPSHVTRSVPVQRMDGVKRQISY